MRLAAILFLAGCTSPLERRDYQRQILATQAAIDREVASLPRTSLTPAAASPDLFAGSLQSRRDELEALSPLGRRDIALDPGLDLTGSATTIVALDLQTAVRTAVKNNLRVQSARLDPAITREQLESAEAIFDAVLFGNATYDKIDEPSTVPILVGTPLASPFSISETTRFETGVRKRFETGGELSLSTDLTRFRNSSPGFTLFPDPAYTSAARLTLTQPLLRGFGDSVNTATIRLTENLHERSILDLERELLQLVADVEQTYWRLAAAERSQRISQWLLSVGVEVRNLLEKRQEFDATPAQFADAVARVEQRKADVIRARREMQAASDALKQLLNDEALAVGGEALLAAADVPFESPMEWNLAETIMSAIRDRPEIEQARLVIDDAAIRQTVADNARLPLLNATGQVAWLGLDNTAGDSYENLADNNFIDYLLGLSFEAPIGNRAAEADYRRARLERSQTIIAFRQAVQSVTLDVKSALRDVITSYELIAASRSFRIAQSENLRALLVEEENLASLTPEFLNLKFTQQESLARAQEQEVQAVAGYNAAIAELNRAMGAGLTQNQIDVEWSRHLPDSTALAP